MRKKYIDALKGITYEEWLKLSTVMNRYFENEVRKSYSKIELTDNKQVENLIRSQFGCKLD